MNWKCLFLDNYAYWNLVWKYFKMSLHYFEKKVSFLSKCLFISIYCAKKLCVTKAQSDLISTPKHTIAQSNPNPSQICHWQSKSKSDFQNGLTIQSKSNHNPTIFGKRQQILNGQVLWCNHGIPKRHLLSTYTLLINQFFENFEKK